MPPRPQSCSICGRAVIYEFGCFNLSDYANGVLTRHLCDVPLPEPGNEAYWRAKLNLPPSPIPEKQAAPSPTLSAQVAAPGKRGAEDKGRRAAEPHGRGGVA